MRSGDLASSAELGELEMSSAVVMARDFTRFSLMLHGAIAKTRLKFSEFIFHWSGKGKPALVISTADIELLLVRISSDIVFSSTVIRAC